MVCEVTISTFREVQKVMQAATACVDEVGVHDATGTIADAKSILGLMSLDYSRPVKVVSENENALEQVLRALAQ